MSDTAGPSRPDWQRPALRAGLEVALVVLIGAFFVVELSSPLLVAVAAVASIVGAVGILFRTLDRQAFAWVRYASKRAQQRQRKRRQERQKRKRQRREQQQRQQRADDGEARQ